MARPQVHGHDIRCLDVISNTMFASGAEEKVIRIFRATKNFTENFTAVTGLDMVIENRENIPEGAAVPALGLSNKGVYAKEGTVKAEREMVAMETYMNDHFTALNVCRIFDKNAQLMNLPQRLFSLKYCDKNF